MNQFKKLRLIACKTVDEAAEEMGVNRASIYKWETGKRCPNPSKISSIANVYGCSVEAVVEAYEAQN